MSLTKVAATFSCDECGTQMVAELEPTWVVSHVGWTVFDLAEDALRGGCGSGLMLTSVHEGKHLCAACTKNVDADYEDRVSGSWGTDDNGNPLILNP